jgi:hypothetical protein
MPEISRKIPLIKTNVMRRLTATAAKNTNLFIDSRVLVRGREILAYEQKILMDRDTVMVFADEAPLLNWAHPCKYLLHDSKTGELYKEVKAQFPPYMVNDVPETFKAFHQPVLPKSEIVYPIRPALRCPIHWPIGNRYAILFSGASNNRHVNDLEFLYRTLIDFYGFADANIYILNYDGTINYNGNPHPVGNWPGDNTPYRMTVNGSGTKAVFETIFDTLKTKLAKDDLLLIHTNNHGGHNGTQSYLCTYSTPSYLASDFADKLATLPTYDTLIVMMEQCHAGGFNSPILSHSTALNTSVSSACEELKSSDGGPDFDPFAEDWIGAITGNTAYGGALASNPDLDSSGKISAREAHTYANSVKTLNDTPVYNESSVSAGNKHLGQRYYHYWPVICKILKEKLQTYYIRKPIPEFYKVIHQKLIPELIKREAEISRLSVSNEAELRKILIEVVNKAIR